MFMTTIGYSSVSRWLPTADQPQLFHEPASKPASYPASPGCHCMMLLAPAEPWLMPCSSSTRSRNTARLPSGFQDGFS